MKYNSLNTPSVPKYKIILVNLGRLRKTIKLHDLPKIPLNYLTLKGGGVFNEKRDYKGSLGKS